MITATVITPPTSLPMGFSPLRVFLAGSIEMGRAEEWQTRMIAALAHLPIVILNPRRADWDPTWVQSKDNPAFRGQVEWELDAMEQSDVILMYLAPGTASPISLMELGLHAFSGTSTAELIVCCPDGFARKGNVDIVCERYEIPVHQDWDSFVDAAIEFITTEDYE